MVRAGPAYCFSEFLRDLRRKTAVETLIIRSAAARASARRHTVHACALTERGP